MEKSLDELWSGAHQKAEAAEEVAEQARAARAEAVAEINQMQQGILAGEASTGNDLHDGLIAVWGGRVNEALVERYERVAAELAEAEPGDLIFLKRHRIDRSGCSGFGAELNYRMRITRALGVIDKRREIAFDYDDRVVFIPAPKFVHDEGGLRSSREVVHTGRLVVDAPFDSFGFERGFRLGSELDRELRADVPVELPAFQHPPIPCMEIVIGREKIREWLAAPEDNLTRDADFKWLRHESEHLDVPAIEPATKWQINRLERLPR